MKNSILSAPGRTRTLMALSALLIACLATPAEAKRSPLPERGLDPGPERLVVRYDPGGSVLTRMAEILNRTVHGDRVEIRGQCHSACTLYLSLENACVYPKATLGFHAPTEPDGRKLSPEKFESATLSMAKYYKEPLRSWYLSTARYETDLLRVKGAELIRLGYKACPTS